MAFSITEACIGCTACVKKCPVSAIDGEKKAQHHINKKRCVECGVCGKVCPKGAVSDALGKKCEKLPRSQWLKPSVDRKSCSACGLCADICIFEAVRIAYPAHPGDLDVFAWLETPDKCVGCGQCAEACPMKAIKMEALEC